MTSITGQTSSKELLQSFSATHPALAAHFTTLISHLIQHQPPNPFQHLEQLSFKLLSPATTAPAHPLLSSPAPASVTSYLAESPYIFHKAPARKPVSADDEEPVLEEEDKAVPSFVPDVASLCALLAEAGVAVSDEEVVLVGRAVVLLAQRDGVESVRWWGRVLTISGRDYYVFEVKKASYDEEEETERLQREQRLAATGQDVSVGRELLGAGANDCLYYVSQSLSAPVPTFTLLPSTAPRFITDARRTHRLLTGDLSAAVGGFPRFAGVEADLLRAQIARISNGTVVVPKGSWKEEEGEVVIEDAEWKGTERHQPVQWTHVRGNIRRDGRVEPPTEDDDDDGDDELTRQDKAAAKAAAAEPKQPLLSPVSASAFACCVSQYGSASASGVVHSAVSLLWPGSVSVVRGREYGSVYVGWGLKQGLRGEAGRAQALPARQTEWEGELVEETEVAPTAEEEQKEREEEEEKMREQAEAGGQQNEDDEVNGLADDDDTAKEEQE